MDESITEIFFKDTVAYHESDNVEASPLRLLSHTDRLSKSSWGSMLRLPTMGETYWMLHLCEPRCDVLARMFQIQIIYVLVDDRRAMQNWRSFLLHAQWIINNPLKKHS